MINVFISNCKTRFICTVDGVPSFIRRSHQQIIESKGLDIGSIQNLTFSFYYQGKGKSIKEFLNE